MKRLFPFMLLLGLLPCLTQIGSSQPAFTNLGFENPILPLVPDVNFDVPAANALPGWTVYYGVNQQTQVIYNTIGLGSTLVCFLGTNGFGASRIEGQYGVMLQGGGQATEASIRQTGLVPALAQSIQFKAQPGFGVFLVSLGGQDIPFVPISTGTNFTLFGGNVSAFAGQSLELKFAALYNSPFPNNWNLDSIVFSSTPVPEPSVTALLALAVSLLGWRWRKTNS